VDAAKQEVVVAAVALGGGVRVPDVVPYPPYCRDRNFHASHESGGANRTAWLQQPAQPF
jgi:hypothetical protein